MNTHFYPTFLGTLQIHWSDKGLEKIDICADLNKKFNSNSAVAAEHELIPLPLWLQDFLSELSQYLTKGQSFSKLPPVNKQNWTPFQKQIYLKLFSTQVGQTITYGKLASLCSRPNAARSVGSAMKRNTLPILIPCHRVLPAGGKLGKYTGGEGPLSKKKLLCFEALHLCSSQKLK